MIRSRRFTAASDGGALAAARIWSTYASASSSAALSTSAGAQRRSARPNASVHWAVHAGHASSSSADGME
eukprot:228579-Prymnesium_polylepis.2